MGMPNFPVYGEDIGSAIEDAEKVIAKIKTNKYSNKDLIKLCDANHIILKSVLEDVNKD